MRRIRYFAGLAALTLFAGCDSQHSEPFFAPPNQDIIITVNGNTRVIKTKSVERGNWAFTLVTPSTGGTVSTNGHTLKVPVGAVTQPTWFMMNVVETNAVQVKLKAWRAADGAPVTQFPKVPVQLTLNAGQLESLDPTGLVIVYLRDDTTEGATEKVASTLNTNNWTVTGYLTHFSSYALAREFSPGID